MCANPVEAILERPNVETGTVTSKLSTRLFYRYQAVNDATANVVIVHGLAEHSGRYLHVLARLATAGFNTLAIDLRGHGRSEGKRVYINRYEEYLADVRSGPRRS